MPKKWLKKYIPDDKAIKNSINDSFFLGKFKNYLKNPNFWRFRRESVARGVAVGLLVAIIPILPFQTILAIVLSILLRANIPIAFLTSWVSNPFTIVPLIFLTYYVGDWILNEYNHEISFHEFSWRSLSYQELKTWFMQFGKAFFVGLPFLAIGLAICGYLLVHLIWRGIDLIQGDQPKK